mmetsp:Transcript_13945/g.18187  ORF Transcript_13945/g.18187 Transcript_13945/m.18187 type:complete len:546 (+) Transcript_13945:294-1931(+)
MGNSVSRTSFKVALRKKKSGKQILPNKAQRHDSNATAPTSAAESSTTPPPAQQASHTHQTYLPEAIHRNKVQKRNSVFLTAYVSDVRMKYHVEPKEIGHGHYGVVRKCQNRITGEWFAIKTVRKMRVRRLEILKREIEILQTLNHPNIIKLVDVFEDEKYIHLVQELCTGGELFDQIIAKAKSEEGHYSERDACKIVKKILEAIAYCHEHHVCHRDLKPENFIFKSTKDSEFKIIDFGLSNFEDLNNQGVMTTRVGTPYYIAPEVLNRKYTKACDLWSIGVIMYILLCGYPPFWGENDYEIFHKVKTEEVKFPTKGWQNISIEAKTLILELLCKNYKERPTATQALHHPWFQMEDEIKHKIESMKKRRSSVPGRLAQYVGLGKFQKHAVNFIANQLTEDEIENLRALFEQFDKDGDGQITVQELWEAFESEGVDRKDLEKQVQEIMNGIDLDGSQTIDFHEFLGAAMDRNFYIREENMMMAFNYFDKKGDGCIAAADLVGIFGSLAHAQEAISDIDIDGDGVLTYDKFKTMMQQCDDISIRDLIN